MRWATVSRKASPGPSEPRRRLTIKPDGGDMAMMKIVPRMLMAAAAFAYVVGGAGSANAAFDHLKCYKVKDSAAKVTYTATVTGLTTETGCQIKVPAQMCCVPAEKSNVTPPPPGGGGTGVPNTFCCYKLKCAKATLSPQSVSDQFGTRSVTPSTAKLLCAPSSPSGAFLDASTVF